MCCRHILLGIGLWQILFASPSAWEGASEFPDMLNDNCCCGCSLNFLIKLLIEYVFNVFSGILSVCTQKSICMIFLSLLRWKEGQIQEVWRNWLCFWGISSCLMFVFNESLVILWYLKLKHFGLFKFGRPCLLCSFKWN